MTQDDINTLAAAFTDPDSAFANGFSVGGEKFVCIKADARSLYGKKVRHLNTRKPRERREDSN